MHFTDDNGERSQSSLGELLRVCNISPAMGVWELDIRRKIVKWTSRGLENLQIKMRALLTRYRFHHPRAAKERLTVPRQMGGSGLIDITGLHDNR